MPVFPRKRAILIGADQYDRLHPLQYSGADVRDIANEFRRSLQFNGEDILEFRCDSALPPRRLDILDKMGKFLAQNVQEDELLVFYFSGHGILDEDDRKDYLLPVDASLHDLSGTGIPVEHFANKLKKTRCNNIVMFIDACRDSNDGAKSALSIGQHSLDALSRGGIVTFFSCDPKERSYEINDLRHGSFTHCVLDAIASGACTTVAEIDQHLRDKVPLLNTKYRKPPQRPYTIINPAEKGQLAIFFREIPLQQPSGQVTRLFERLGELMYAGTLDEKSFCDAISFLERAQGSPRLNERDTRRLKYIELLCEGRFTSKAFDVAWRVVDRRESTTPPKTL